LKAGDAEADTENIFDYFLAIQKKFLKKLLKK